ncbi:unnamed protein product [Discosporangium mesarthrocarpum]
MKAVAWYCENPGRVHCEAVQRIPLATSGRGITCGGDANCDMLAYADSDYAEDTNTRCSLSGEMVMLAEGAVSWFLVCRNPWPRALRSRGICHWGKWGRRYIYLCRC